LLEVRGLTKSFGVGSGRVLAVSDVGFQVRRGEAVGLIGQSGSGKSTIARLLLRLERWDRGTVSLDGKPVAAADRALELRRRIQLIFQDPFASLNPVHDVEHHIARPLLRHGLATPTSVRRQASELLSRVGLDPPGEFLSRMPAELSGGQRQRVAIARALAVEPDLLVADEPTSMLDVSIRTSVLGLLAALKRERGLGIVLITHDLASAKALADRLVVLYRGSVVEDGPTSEVLSRPAHPYTQALLSAVAAPRALARSQAPSLTPCPTGCAFAHRCPIVVARCTVEAPTARTVGGRTVRCHRFETGASGAEGAPQ
jgi:oligopeptide/dipeptide ABC transporter ATP-binding protein